MNAQHDELEAALEATPETELNALRQALQLAEEQRDLAQRQAKELQVRLEAQLEGTKHLLDRIYEIASFAPINTPLRHRKLISPELLASRSEDSLREYTAGLINRSISCLSVRRRPPKRRPTDFLQLIDIAVHYVRNHWPLSWAHLIFDAPIDDVATSPGVMFEVKVGSMPTVSIDPDWMLTGFSHLLIYALYRTQRNPPALRFGSRALPNGHIIYVTDSDEDVVPVLPEPVVPRHTSSPEFAMFRDAVQRHGGVVWKQRAGPDCGAILFFLPNEQPDLPAHPAQV